MGTRKLVAIGEENVADAFYRYKRPVLSTQLQSRNNGLKTAITNLHLLSQALDRPLDCFIKHFLVDLGTNAFLKNDVAVLKGDVSSSKNKVLNLSSKNMFNEDFVATRRQNCLHQRKTACQACGNITKLEIAPDDKVVKVWF